MSLNLDDLEAIARAATPGPWHQGAHYIGAGGEPYDPEAVVGQASILCDAEHIAAFDPPTVRALITRIREAETRLREAEAVIARAIDAGEHTGYSHHKEPVMRVLATYKPTNQEGNTER